MKCELLVGTFLRSSFPAIPGTRSTATHTTYTQLTAERCEDLRTALSVLTITSDINISDPNISNSHMNSCRIGMNESFAQNKLQNNPPSA